MAVAKSLVAVHDGSFLFGPHIVLSLNATLLGYCSWPRRSCPGGSACSRSWTARSFLWGIAMLLGASSPTSPFAVVLGLPMLAFEASLAIQLIVKGFRPQGLASLEKRTG